MPVTKFTPINSFHVKSMTKDEFDVVVRTKIGKPVPCVCRFARNDDIMFVGFNQRKKHIRFPIFDFLMNENSSFTINNTNVTFASVKIHAAYILFTVRVKMHKSASFGFYIKAYANTYDLI